MNRAPLLIAALLIAGLFGVVGYALVADPAAPTVAVERAPAPDPIRAPAAPLDPEPDLEVAAWPPDAPRTLHGEIIDLDGVPIPGATITVRYADAPDRTARADDRGAYELARLDPDIAEITTTALGYEDQTARAPALPVEPRVRWDVVLEPREGVGGHVVQNGQPVTRGIVWMYDAGGRGERESFGRVDLGPGGRFFFPWPERFTAPLVIRALSDEHGRGVVRTDTPARDLVIELPGGAFVEGQVVDTRGRAVTRFSITAGSLGRTGGPDAQSVEDANGAFRIGPVAVARDKTTVQVVATGYRPATVQVDATPGQTTRGVRVVLDGSTTITGRVTDARTGQPIAGAELKPTRLGRESFEYEAAVYTDTDGRYILETVPGKRVSMIVTADGYRSTTLGGVMGQRGGELVRDVTLTSSQRDATPHSELTGIGAAMRRSREGLVVARIFDGGPASEVLGQGDLITAVDGVPARGHDVDTLIEAIRGEAGTDVVLHVKRGGRGEAEEVILTRDRVAIPMRN